MAAEAVGPPLDERSPVCHRLPNGIELHAVREGRGTPLIFIHGAMGDWRSWAPQWPEFTRHFDCVSYSRRYSHPNHNPVDAPDHSALQEADDLALLMDALGWPDAVLVGSSYGGFTALALAAAQPRRVRAVVAVEPPMMKYAERSETGRAVAAAFRRDTIEPANAAFRAGDDERAARLMTGGINGAASPLNDGEAMRRRLQNLRAMKMLAMSSDEFPWLSPAVLGTLPMPVLLLSGRRTAPVHRAIFEALCEAMPRAEREVIDDAGHGVSRDQPEVFNRRVLAFLGGRR